ncbi:MAG: AAA family ATPase [Candidatus Margulisiibacteriota bacterium]
MPKQTDFIGSIFEPGWRLEETHIDFVIIGPKYAYKIKKKVKFSFVDYSTLAKRKYFCEREIELNRRYSPSVYLGTVPIFYNEKIVDYAVKMKTLPEARRLDRLLDKNLVTKAMIRRLAGEIARFHKRARTDSKIQAFGDPKHLWKVYEKDFLERNVHKNAVSPKMLQEILGYLEGYLKNRKDLFLERMKAGKIKDLHGDLHPENIFYTNKPIIFDCIEFNDNFRYIDVAAEISFLLMELEFHGKQALHDELLAAYIKISGDNGILKLLNFYKCHFASVRGFVCSLAIECDKAKEYFKLAHAYAWKKTRLIAIGGVIGTGKSTLAKELSNKFGLKLINSDRVRKELARIPLYARTKPGLIDKLYSTEFSERTYKTMLSQAEEALKQGNGVILDATFSRRKLRKGLLELANKYATDFQYIEMTAPKKTLIKRLTGRKRTVSDAGPELLQKFIQEYEPPIEIPKENYLRICQ